MIYSLYLFNASRTEDFMDSVKIIELKESILSDNNADADLLREELRREHTFYLNVMSSPGSGKTSVLLGTIAGLKEAL